MSFFRRFRANLNLKNPKKRKIEKSEPVAVQCLKYKIISEFTEEQVFNTNPRHITEPHFTPTQHRKVQTKSLSENDLQWKRLATERPQEEKKSEDKTKNVIWPSDSEISTHIELKEKPTDAKTKEGNDETDETKHATKEPIRSILKNANVDNKKDHVENSKGKVNFGFQNGEEGTYEPFEKIDDYVVENTMYFSDQTQEADNDLYVVHKVNHEEKKSVTENDYESPIHSVRDNYDQSQVQPPLYNTLTHPKLNPTMARNGGLEDHDRYNTFGNTQKLNKIGYSNQAANIFFDSDEEFEDTKLNSGRLTFADNSSEMSA